MKPLNSSALTLVSGGLNYFGTPISVSSTGIPQPIFNKIEFALQSSINNLSDYNYWMVDLCANGCTPYLETYYDNLIDALIDSGCF